MTSLVASINKGTADTGITATTNSAGSLILTQANAEISSSPAILRVRAAWA